MPTDLPSPSSPATIVLTESSAGKPVALSNGQHLRITLQETPATGYRWTLPEPCAAHLDLQSDTASHDGDQTPGAPGVHTWAFQAKTSGTCELKFVSARAWQKEAPGRSLDFPLTIAPS